MQLFRRPRTRVAVVVLVAVVALSLGAGATTFALFQDSDNSTGTVRAADNFGFPDDAVAYDDANGNDAWDGSETTYTLGDLSGLTASGVDLRFHDSISTLRSTNIDVDVAAIGLDADFKIQQSSTVRLIASGEVAIDGITIQQTSSVDIRSDNDNVDLRDTSFKSISQLKVRALAGDILLNKKTKCQNTNVDMEDQGGPVSC